MALFPTLSVLPTLCFVMLPSVCGGADLRGCSKNSSEPVVGLHARCFQLRPSCGIHQRTASCMLNLHPLAPLPCGHTLKPPTEYLHSHGVRMLCYIMHVCSASSPLPLLHRSGKALGKREVLDPVGSGGCHSFQFPAGSGATEYSSCIWGPSFWQEVMAESGRRKLTHQFVQ